MSNPLYNLMDYIYHEHPDTRENLIPFGNRSKSYIIGCPLSDKSSYLDLHLTIEKDRPGFHFAKITNDNEFDYEKISKKISRNFNFSVEITKSKKIGKRSSPVYKHGAPRFYLFFPPSDQVPDNYTLVHILDYIYRAKEFFYDLNNDIYLYEGKEYSNYCEFRAKTLIMIRTLLYINHYVDRSEEFYGYGLYYQGATDLTDDIKKRFRFKYDETRDDLYGISCSLAYILPKYICYPEN